MTTRWERFQQEVMHGNVVLNFTSYPKGDLSTYAHAYQEVANSLVEVFREKPYYSDAEACPIVFLYRPDVDLRVLAPQRSSFEIAVLWLPLLPSTKPNYKT
jgi:hypothetical protein